jgi:hypothetical protein
MIAFQSPISSSRTPAIACSAKTNMPRAYASNGPDALRLLSSEAPFHLLFTA